MKKATYTFRLRKLREQQKLTQKEIAGLLGIQRNQYRRYENGERNCPVWIIIELAYVYNVSADYLLNLSDNYERR